MATTTLTVNRFGGWADRLGLSLALLCAVHCLGTALLLISFPALWLQLRYRAPEYAWLLYAERWVASASLVLAGLVLVLAWRRLAAPAARSLLIVGAVCVSAGLWWPALAHSLWSVPAVSGGALMIAGGHLLHLRGWRRCRLSRWNVGTAARLAYPPASATYHPRGSSCCAPLCSPLPSACLRLPLPMTR